MKKKKSHRKLGSLLPTLSSLVFLEKHQKRPIEMETNAHLGADGFGNKYLGTDTRVCQSQSDALMTPNFVLPAGPSSLS